VSGSPLDGAPWYIRAALRAVMLAYEAKEKAKKLLKPKEDPKP
jgi:hypothetical protein